MLVSLVYLVACRLLAFVLLLARSDRSKELEILVLRHELGILRRQVGRPQFEPRDRPMLALDLQPPDPTAALAAAPGDPPAPRTGVQRPDLLGGLIHEYELAPAA